MAATIIDDGSGAGDPLFRDANGVDGNAGTEDDDLRLSIGSPAKDVGVNSFLPAGVATDLDGGPRIDGPFVDLGPYEWSDCNNNDTDDGGDIFLGTSLDCNNNGLPDECDITNGTSEDCTGNDIPDECEPDCQPNGVADSCDIAGASADTIGPADGIPDECQDDCNGNLIPDEFDLAGNDCNFNGVPDDCESGSNGVPNDCAGPPLPATMGCDSDADCCDSSVIACQQDTDCAGTAVDRCSASLCWCPGGTNEECGSGAVCSPANVCLLLDPAGARCSDQTVPPSPRFCECPSGFDDACLSAAVCISDFCYVPRNRYVSFRTNTSPETDGRTAFRVRLKESTNNLPACVNKIRWVRAPTPDNTATLFVNCSNNICFRDDWPDVVHIGDRLIAPDSIYEIWAVHELNGEFSPVVEFPTAPIPGAKFWGDAIGIFNGARWTAPNGAASIDDVVAALKTFQNPSNTPGCGTPPCNATHVSITDISVINDNILTGVPNRVVNTQDIFVFILGFQGAQYQDRQPETCGVLGSEAPPPGPPSTLSLVLSSAIISPDETVDVEVFLDVDLEGFSGVAGNLGAYQLALEVTGGDAGALDFESRFITAREDYVFDGMNSLELTDDVSCHIGALDFDAVGVAVSSPVYLGTFRYRASSDADGVFHIGFQGVQDTFLTMADGYGISNLVIGAGVDIEIECFFDADCDDGKECTDDACMSGACSNVNDDTNTCGDGNDCTDDSCSSGVCVGVNDDTNACSDGNDCTDDSCNGGVCVGANDDTNTCSDGNECTDDSCNGGVCVGVNDDTNTCTDGNDCTDEACASGVCTATNEPVGTTCDDGRFCTATDECDGSGTCVGSGSPCGSVWPYCCESLSICFVLPCQ